MYKFKLSIFQSTNNNYYWNIKSLENGKIIVASSEGFVSKQNAKNNLLLVWKAIQNSEVDTSEYNE